MVKIEYGARTLNCCEEHKSMRIPLFRITDSAGQTIVFEAVDMSFDNDKDCNKALVEIIQLIREATFSHDLN